MGDRRGEATVRTQIAHILLAVGDCYEALSEGMAAMTLADSANDASAMVEVLRVVGHSYLAVSQFDCATAFCERGIETSRRIGDAISEGALLDTLGCVYGTMAYGATAAGDDKQARILNLRAIDASRQAMTIASAYGHRANEGTANTNVAEGLVQDGRPEGGLALMESCAAYRPDPGSGASHHLDTWGSICLALGRLDEAIDRFERANASRSLAEDLQRSNEQLSRRADDLMHESLHEALTDLGTRRLMERLLDAGMSRYAIAIIDVDYVKAVNDG